MSAPNRRVGSVALSCDGRFALTGHGDGAARLWELEGGHCVLRLEGHTTQIWSVALDREVHHALTCSLDGTVLLWELDWEYEFPEPADWDERARPFLDTFLRTRVPYAEPLRPGGHVRRRPLRSGTPAWSDADLDELVRELGQLGFGWLRRDTVRAELERMAAAR